MLLPPLHLINNEEINMKINKEQLALDFSKSTGCTSAKAIKLTERYITECTKHLIKHITKQTYSEYWYIDVNNLRIKLSSIRVNKERFYVWNEFQKLKHRIVVPITTGNNISGKLTLAKINYDLKSLIIECSDSTELVQELYSGIIDDIEVEGLDADVVPIDLKSLNAYIENNKNSAYKGEQHRAKLEYNLREAQKYQLVAEYFDGYIHQIVNESVFGRKYYKGPNLQTCPSVVRHAALGDCYKFDIENSVFSWKLTYIKQLVNGAPCAPYTDEYLEFKRATRKRLAKTVFGTSDGWAVKIVKRAITAIGFGATSRAGGYVENGTYKQLAISEIITSREKLNVFLNDNWVKGFIKEQKLINDIIFEYEVNELNREDEFKAISNLVNKRNTLRKNSVISYLYQHYERNLLNEMYRILSKGEILLGVHDCVYTKHNVNLQDMRVCLRKLSPYLNLDREEIKGYTFVDFEFEKAHAQHIHEEDQRANRYEL